MKRYSIKVFSCEERDLLEKVINDEFGIETKTSSSLTGGWYIDFKTDNKTWKSIKKCFKLEVTTVYAKRKIEL